MMRNWSVLILLIAVIGCQGKTEKTAKSPEGEKTGGSPEVPQPMEPAFNPLSEPTAKEIENGWVRLFDGDTLFGWEANDAGQKDAVNWRVEDGAITADSGKPGLLLTYVPFADFEFRCEYRMAEDGNSGVFLRTVPNPTDPAVDCYELNFCEVHDGYPTGSLVKREKGKQPLLNPNQWVPVRVVVQGTSIQAWFGEEKVLDFTDKSDHILRSGRIGLQKNEGKIQFRHVAAKPLGMESLFNGKDLSGWRIVPGSKSEFQVEDGTIHVTGGKGFLETEQTWEDFVFQAEAITHGEGLNSGVFFRGLPGKEGEDINGYEMQIQHQPNPNDAKEYVGDRTGGIFRRADPRSKEDAAKVVSKDNEWCNLTLVASGPRFQTWVNGYPMVTWEDDRIPDENPRRGLRLKAGHISLQGHDPTTDLEFRDLQIAPLPEEQTDEGPLDE